MVRDPKEVPQQWPETARGPQRSAEHNGAKQAPKQSVSVYEGGAKVFKVITNFTETLIIGQRIDDYILAIIQILHPKMKDQGGFDHKPTYCPMKSAALASSECFSSSN